MSFIEIFTNPSKMMSEAGYSFTQLKSALVWLDEVDEMQLRMKREDFLMYPNFLRQGLSMRLR
jgi:hypothetical protein